MTVSLPFTLTNLSDAPPDSWAAQQYRAANSAETTTSGTRSRTSESSIDDDDEEDFAGALATAMSVAGKVSPSPVMAQATSSAATNSEAVSASAVSPVMPSLSGTGQQAEGQQASGVSATAIIPGVSANSAETKEMTGEGVASALGLDSGQTLASAADATTTGLSSELTPLRILMLQRFRVPLANTAGESSSMQDITQISIVSTETSVNPSDTAALFAATQSVLQNSLPTNFVSGSAVIMPNPDKVSMELAEELVDAESTNKANKSGSISALLGSGNGGSRLDSLRGLLSRLSERLNVALEKGDAETADGLAAIAAQSTIAQSGVSSIMAGVGTADASFVRTAEGVSSVMPDIAREAAGVAADSQQQSSSTPVVAGASTSPLSNLLTDSLRQPLSTQVSQAIYQHVILNNARDNSSMTVRLDPPELGELVIRLSRTDDGIAVKVSAREPVTMDMLLARGEEIESRLSDQNLNLAGIEFLAPDTANGEFSEWMGQRDREHPEHETRRTSPVNPVSVGGVSGAPVVAAASGFGQLSFRA